MKTEQLIDRLAAQGNAVRPLPAPWVRASIWFAVALPYVAIVVGLHRAVLQTDAVWSDPLVLLEQLAALATAVTAAVAAFASVVPGYDRRVLWLPVAPLALWLLLVGGGCVRDWMRYGADGLTLESDWSCLEPAILLGIVPLTAMLVMLRRGAPLRPFASTLLGALAVAALANAGLRLFHGDDASIIVLVWHIGVAAALAALTTAFGSRLLRWRHRAPA